MTPIQKECLSLSEHAFELVKSVLPAGSVEIIREYIFDHNEWGLGIEMMVDIIIENDTTITTEQKSAIVRAMCAMKIDRSQHSIKVIE